MGAEARAAAVPGQREAREGGSGWRRADGRGADDAALGASVAAPEGNQPGRRGMPEGRCSTWLRLLRRRPPAPLPTARTRSACSPAGTTPRTAPREAVPFGAAFTNRLLPEEAGPQRPPAAPVARPTPPPSAGWARPPAGMGRRRVVPSNPTRSPRVTALRPPPYPAAHPVPAAAAERHSPLTNSRPK